jgi:hypothetical protein
MMHSTSWPSWWISHGVEKSIWVSNLNEEPEEGNDADDHPPPIVKFPQAHAQLLSNLCILHRFLVINVMNMQSFMNKLNKMSISNINKHHQRTIDSYFCSM